MNSQFPISKARANALRLLVLAWSLVIGHWAFAQPYTNTCVLVNLPAFNFSANYSNRPCLYQYLSVPNGIAGGVIGADMQKFITDSNGSFTISNTQIGLHYIKVLAPTNGQSGRAWDFFFWVDATNLGTIDASDHLAAPNATTYPPGGAAWTVSAADARYARATNTLGSAAFQPVSAFQPANDNLTGLSAFSTNMLAYLSQLQLLSNSLGSIAAYPSNAFQPANTNLTNLAAGNLYNSTASNLTLKGTFTFNVGVTAGYVLTVDGQGNGTWQAATGGSGGSVNTNVLQVGNQNITNFGLLTTNAFINAAQLATLSNSAAAAYQPINTNLNNLSIGTIYNPTASNVTLTGSLTYLNGTTAGYVMTVDGFGHASWQAAAAGDTAFTNFLQVGNQNLTNFGLLTTNAFINAAQLATLSNSAAAVYQPINTNLNNLSIGQNYNGTFSNATLRGSLTYADGATNGFVLTTDGSGHSSWQPASGIATNINTNILQVGSANLTNFALYPTNSFQSASARLSDWALYHTNAFVSSSNGAATNLSLVNPSFVNASNTGLPFRSPGAQAGSEQFGYNASAVGVNSIAFGDNSLTSADNSVALGSSASTGEANSIAIGYNSSSLIAGDIALGGNALADGGFSTALGNAEADGTNSIAIGTLALASLSNSVAIGPGAQATATNQMALGDSSENITIAGTATVSGVFTAANAANVIGGNGAGLTHVTATNISGTLIAPKYTNGLIGDVHTINIPGIGQAVVSGLVLSNSSPAVSGGSDQWSPALDLAGNGVLSGSSVTRHIYLLNELEKNSPLYGQLVSVDGSGNVYFSVAPDSPFTAPSGFSTAGLNASDHLVATNGGTIAGTLTNSSLTASRVLVSGTGGTLTSSSVTTTTLSYLDATSSLQTQIGLTVTNVNAGTNLVVSTNGRSVTINNPFQVIAGTGVTTSTNGALITVNATGGGGGTGIQNPLNQNVNAAGYSLTNIGNTQINGTNFTRFENVSSNLTVTNLGTATAGALSLLADGVPSLQIWIPSISLSADILANTNYGNTITGGSGNSLLGGSFNSIGGGGGYSSIVGGYNNLITNSSGDSFIGGGQLNIMSNSVGGVIPGGDNNFVSGNDSFAAGNSASATNSHAFVWSDGTATGSTSNQQFIIQATKGVGINTNNPGTNALAVNGGVAANSFAGDGSRLTNLLAYSLSFSNVAAAAPTNYTVNFSGSVYNYILGSATNVCFQVFTNGPGPVTYIIQTTGTNIVILWPTNMSTLNTNGLSLSGTNWSYTLTNKANSHAVISFFAATNLQATLSMTNVTAAFSPSP